MKTLAISILTILLMAQTFNKWLLVISFNINREYIAQKLCENRDKPKLNCKGNCVMMKKMKQEKKEQELPGTNKIEVNTHVLSSKSFFASEPDPVLTSNIRRFIAFNTGRPVDRSFAFFHPPSA